MGIVNTKATAVTHADADSRTSLTPAHIARGNPNKHRGVVAVAAADDDTSVFRIGRVRSKDLVSSIKIAHTALTSGTDYDIGLHSVAEAGGAVVDKDFFADGLDLSSARTVLTEVRYSSITASAANGISSGEKRVWEQLGLTSDPGLEYDLTITANTIGSAAGTILVEYETVSDV